MGWNPESAFAKKQISLKNIFKIPPVYSLRGLFQTLLNNGASCRDAEITSTSIDDGNGAFRTSQNIFNPRTQK